MNKGVDGGIPKGSLLLASDGNFYGMNSDGGPKGYGNIFKITPAGKYSVLYNFNPSLDGGSPQGSLIQATDGSLYGLTISGGAKAGGTAFKITLAGTYTVLHHFDYATEGNNPEGNLLQASDGNFYGMTSNNAHIFQITSAGTFSLMRALVSSTDGYMPLGSPHSKARWLSLRHYKYWRVIQWWHNLQNVNHRYVHCSQTFQPNNRWKVAERQYIGWH